MHNKTWLLILFVLAALLMVSACGDDDDDDNDDAADDDASPGDDDDENDDDDNDDVGPPRSFKLAAMGYQYKIEPYRISDAFEVDGFDGRIDLIAAHMDFWGKPWQAFATGGEPPALWVALMEDIKQQADDLSVGVYLSLTPLSGMRDGLSDVTVVKDGAIEVEPYPVAGCFDFDNGPNAATIRTAYKAYVRWMVDLFQPEFLTHAIELNMNQVACPAEYDSLLGLLDEVYAQEKAVNPALPIFPTFVNQWMWGYDMPDGGCAIGDETCLVANLALVDGLEKDRYAISNYPSTMQWVWSGIPADFYSRPAELTGLTPVFAEVGWNSKPVVLPYPTLADECFDLLEGSDSAQTAYLEFLFAEAERLDSDLVTWWSLRDYLPAVMLDNCPCVTGDVWCVLYEAVYDIGLLGAWLHWGSMGLLDYDVYPKPALATWDATFARPLAN
jgi:hypothetical protein